MRTAPVLSGCPPPQSLRELMEGGIRKCGWDLAGDAAFWRDAFGVAIHNAIELLPCCAAYFPAEVGRFLSRSGASPSRQGGGCKCDLGGT